MDKAKKINSLFIDNEEGRLVLPNFQRDFEWNADEQKKLLSSVLAMLPIGSLLILEGEKDDFATRQLCYLNDDFEQNDRCLYLLDGQQRMSALRSIFSNLLGDKDDWETKYDSLYRGLRYRWFLNVKEGSEDIFGYDKLRFKNIKEYEPGQLVEQIVNKKITKQNKKDWYHPAFYKDESGKELNGHKLNNAIAKKAAAEGIVPLYNVYESVNGNEKSVLEYALDRIATERITQLKAEVEDGERLLTDLLKPIDPDIDELIEEDSDESLEQINYAWSSLASDWKKDVINYLKGMLEQNLHIIQLPSNEIGRATAIYESINKGGLSLSTYDLVIARAARIRSEKSLTQKIITQLEKTIQLPKSLIDNLKGNIPNEWSSDIMGSFEDNKLATTVRDQYLNLLSILSHSIYMQVNEIKIDFIKKHKILSVSAEDINSKTENTIKGIVRACAFLQFRCGKISIKDLNYKLMLLPMAYVLLEDNVWENKAMLAKIEYWYWASLFGGSYRENQAQRCIDDIRDLHKWINGSSNPFENRFKRILNFEGYSNKELLLNEDKESDVPSPIKKGILEYVLSNQPRDFYPDKEILLNAWDVAQEREVEFNTNVKKPLKIEDHHVIPLGTNLLIGESSREIRKEKKHILNSPLNRTYISEYANALILNKSPEKYFEDITDVAQWGHSLNNQWEKQKNETDENYYRRMLNTRYCKLLENIKVELNDLKLTSS